MPTTQRGRWWAVGVAGIVVGGGCGGAIDAEPSMDAGVNQPDAGGTKPDGGVTEPDGGEQDADVSKPDAGASNCRGVETNPDIADERPAPERASHRPVAEACAPERPCNHVFPGQPTAVCSSHDGCMDGANGRCQTYGFWCTYDVCFADEDCPLDMLCDCAGGENGSHHCLRARCRVDADCADGYGCSPSLFVECFNLRPVAGYFCRTPSDECATDVDCPGGACVFDEGIARWRCTLYECID